ncbi:hypothetical protein MKZ38_009560 [Zalerion maritima]|uniref:Uncharacterized protein n=1 Tax=Zalerion maritima TaxID=339359 RepID=A0AAD5RV27_9PEZI|nr:hypothetical protein MKZ38_009560 [Zalerion maritima]
MFSTNPNWKRLANPRENVLPIVCIQVEILHVYQFQHCNDAIGPKPQAAEPLLSKTSQESTMSFQDLASKQTLLNPDRNEKSYAQGSSIDNGEEKSRAWPQLKCFTNTRPRS